MTLEATPVAAPAQTSNITYQPPAETPVEEYAAFNDEVRDVISEIEGEWNPPPEVEDEAPVEAAPEVEAEVPDEKDDPAVTRGMDRLVQREVALQTREAQIAARESRVSALETEVTQLRAKMPATDLTDKLGHSPTEAIKAAGQDPEFVLRVLLAEHLRGQGKEVPADLQKAIEKADSQREMKSIRAELARREANDQAVAYFNNIALGARDYLKTVGSKDTPTLAGLSKSDPDRAHREIMEEITADARRRSGADPNGEPLTYPEAAARVEARLSDYKALLGSAAPASTSDTKQAPVAKTPPQQKPPTKPLKPWQRAGEDIYAKGLDEAVREFHRSEAAAKARR
jgi:hypothetical protein